MGVGLLMDVRLRVFHDSQFANAIQWDKLKLQVECLRNGDIDGSHRWVHCPKVMRLSDVARLPPHQANPKPF